MSLVPVVQYATTGEACFSNKYGGGGGGEGVCGPPLDSMPEGVHAPKGAAIVSEQVRTISEDGKLKAVRYALLI